MDLDVGPFHGLEAAYQLVELSLVLLEYVDEHVQDVYLLSV